MKLKNKLLWILDKPRSAFENENDKYRENIDFVHSLGLKCDCVGWCAMDLDRPDIADIFEKIECFCAENGWKARGFYERRYTEFDSDWYRIAAPRLKGDSEIMFTVDEDGKKMGVRRIKAYKNSPKTPISDSGDLLVSERFKDACVRNGLDCVDFCWVEDTGRYAAEQFFQIYPHNCLARVATGELLRYSKVEITCDCDLYKAFEKLDGHLPRLVELFYDLRVYLPYQYPRAEMPNAGFALSNYHRDAVLVHKSTAEVLLREKVISINQLEPVLLYDELPAGYCERKTHKLRKPHASHFAAMQEKYTALMKKTRPKYLATEKTALSALRKIKAENKQYFGKRMQKEVADGIDLRYAPVKPYYCISDGGYIFDEYRFLPYNEAVLETQEFFTELNKEELLEVQVAGIVIGSCANGDRVLLSPDGTVARFSHETPEYSEVWPSLAQFFVDVIEE